MDVLAHGVMKDGAASDNPGNMQSQASHTEEQLSTQLASKGTTLMLPVPQCYNVHLLGSHTTMSFQLIGV